MAAFDAGERLLGEHPDDSASVDLWLDLQIDGRSQVYMWLEEPSRMAVVLAAVRPVLEAREVLPESKLSINSSLASSNLSGGTASMTRSWPTPVPRSPQPRKVAASTRSAFRTYDLGFDLLWHDDLDEAEQCLTVALGISGRVGDPHLRARCLSLLALTALRGHDRAAVASLAPQALEAARAASCGECAAEASVTLPWLAWSEGNFAEVQKLAAEALSGWKNTSIDAFHWVCLWPLIATRLAEGKTAEAIEASRELLAPSQHRLPDELETAVMAAANSWDKGDHQIARSSLGWAVELAEQLRYL